MIKLGLLLSLILMPNAVAYKTEKICEKKMTKKDKLGVIVPYRNRHEHLQIFKKVISNYLSFRDIDYEIIIVDNNSQDRSKKIISELVNKHKNIKSIFLKKSSIYKIKRSTLTDYKSECFSFL